MTETILRIISQHTIDNPIKSFEIELITGLTGAEIRCILHELRLSKHPIGSTADGYFMAINKAELEHTIAQLMSRATKIIAVAKALEECFASQEQLVLL